MPVIFSHYVFSGDSRTVEVQPHGNSKVEVPFYPARRKLLKDIKLGVEKGISATRLYSDVRKYDMYKLLFIKVNQLYSCSP